PGDGLRDIPGAAEKPERHPRREHEDVDVVGMALDDLLGRRPERFHRLEPVGNLPLPGGHGGEIEAGVESPGPDARRDPVGERHEGVRVRLYPLGLEKRVEKARPVRLVDAGDETVLKLRGYRTASGVPADDDPRLLEHLADAADAEGEILGPLDSGAEIFRAVAKVHLAPGEDERAARDLEIAVPFGYQHLEPAAVGPRRLRVADQHHAGGGF